MISGIILWRNLKLVFSDVSGVVWPIGGIPGSEGRGPENLLWRIPEACYHKHCGLGTGRPGAHVPNLIHRRRSPVPTPHTRLAYRQNLNTLFQAFQILPFWTLTEVRKYYQWIVFFLTNKNVPAIINIAVNPTVSGTDKKQ